MAFYEAMFAEQVAEHVREGRFYCTGLKDACTAHRFWTIEWLSICCDSLLSETIKA